MAEISIEYVLDVISRKYGGEVRFSEPLKRHNTMHVGGTARAWYEPSCLDELAEVVGQCRDSGTAFMVAGNGSNILMPDGRCDLIFISLSNEGFCGKRFDGCEVTAGSGEKLSSLISESCSLGMSGLEGLVGIPGTVGGAIVKNAGYRTDISSVLARLKVMDAGGNIRSLLRDEIKMGYRESSIRKGDIIIEAVFRLERSDPVDLRAQIKDMFLEKMKTQPVEEKTLGCVFKNPQIGGRPAGWLIDSCALKGTRVGGAFVSEKHANFIVNDGTATSGDVRTLIEEVRYKVKDTFNVSLELEIDMIDGHVSGVSGGVNGR